MPTPLLVPFCNWFDQYKRFVRPELVLHWVNALPFVLLMLTGGTMLASRFWQMERELFRLVELVHKVCAATGLVGLPVTVLWHARLHWQRHLRSLFRWGVQDILWMVQSARGVYNRTATIPWSAGSTPGRRSMRCWWRCISSDSRRPGW